MITGLMTYVDEIDVWVDKIYRTLQKAARTDPEINPEYVLAEPLQHVQKKLDRAAAGLEAVDLDLRKREPRR